MLKILSLLLNILFNKNETSKQKSVVISALLSIFSFNNAKNIDHYYIKRKKLINNKNMAKFWSRKIAGKFFLKKFNSFVLGERKIEKNSHLLIFKVFTKGNIRHLARKAI